MTDLYISFYMIPYGHVYNECVIYFAICERASTPLSALGFSCFSSYSNTEVFISNSKMSHVILTRIIYI